MLRETQSKPLQFGLYFISRYIRLFLSSFMAIGPLKPIPQSLFPKTFLEAS